jgi:DNA-binding TFAR19-related protein (PDSD5 family)
MMFRILFIALFAFSLQGDLLAQASNAKKGAPKNQGKKPSPEVMAARQAANLQKQLGLTEEQRSDIEKAALNRISKMEAIQEKYKGAGSENRERGKDMRIVRQEFVDAVNKILTPTQQSAWKKLREEKKAKKNAGKGNGKGKGQGQGGTVPASEIDPNEDVDEI